MAVWQTMACGQSPGKAAYRLAYASYHYKGPVVSPDGKYVIVYQYDEVDKFAVYKTKDRNSAKRKSLINVECLSVTGFAWLPGRPHTLVASVKRSAGPPYIGLWSIRDCGASFRTLLRGSLPPKHGPDGEFLMLWSVASDGRSIAYKHDEGWRPDYVYQAPSGAAAKEDYPYRKHCMTIPF